MLVSSSNHQGVQCHAWRSRGSARSAAQPAERYLTRYSVRPHDTIDSIADRLHASPSAILEANSGKHELQEGSVLSVWCGEPSSDTTDAQAPSQPHTQVKAGHSGLKGTPSPAQQHERRVPAQRMHAASAAPSPFVIARKMALGPFGAVLGLGLLLYTVQRTLAWRRAHPRPGDAETMHDAVPVPQTDAASDTNPRVSEVEGWVHPPGWLQQPGNVWMDLTDQLEGLGPGPLPQDCECLIIFEDREEGLSYSRARSRISEEEFPIEGIRPFGPWDVLETAVKQDVSIACFYRGSLGAGIESLGEEQLMHKLLVAAQVCTHSLAVRIRQQPRQQLYQHPPSTSQQPNTSSSALTPETNPSTAASASASASAATSASAGSRPAGPAITEAAAGAVPDKPPFKKGKWAGGREVEGLINRGARQTVDDGPRVSGKDRAQGYRRMRTPSQAVIKMTGAPSPNTPEQWPANAAPKAHRQVLSDAKASAASFQAKQPKAGSIAAQTSASHSMQEAAAKLEVLSADMQQASSHQETQAPTPDEQQSASQSLQQAAKELHPILSHPHAVSQEAAPQQRSKVPSEQRQSASHLLQAASAAMALHPDNAQEEQAAANHRLTASREQASESHQLQSASAATAPPPGSGQAHPLQEQALAQDMDTTVLKVPLSASHDLQQAAAAVAAALPSDTGQAAAASQDVMPVPNETVPASQEAMAAAAVALQPDSGQYAPDQQPLMLGTLADKCGQKEGPSAEPHSPTSAQLGDGSPQDQQPPPEPGSLPLKPFQPSSTPTSAADLEQEALAAAGQAQEPAVHPVLVPVASELGVDAADLAVASLIPEPPTLHAAGTQDASADLMVEIEPSTPEPELNGTAQDSQAMRTGSKWHSRPAASLKPPVKPFNAQLQMASLDWAIFDAMVKDLVQQQQQQPAPDVDLADLMQASGPSVDWLQYSMVHVIWRVPGNAPLPSQGKSPPGNPLCLLLSQQQDTMVVLQDGDEADEAANLLEGILQRLPHRAAERIVSLPVPPAFLSQSQSDPRKPHLCWLPKGALTISQLRQLRQKGDAMAAFRTFQQASVLIAHERLLPSLQQAQEAEDAKQQEHQEMADMMKNMFQSGSDGKAAAGMFGDLPFPFPGQPPEKEAVPDAEKLLQQLQAMMEGRASPADPETSKPPMPPPQSTDPEHWKRSVQQFNPKGGYAQGSHPAQTDPTLTGPAAYPNHPQFAATDTISSRSSNSSSEFFDPVHRRDQSSALGLEGSQTHETSPTAPTMDGIGLHDSSAEHYAHLPARDEPLSSSPRSTPRPAEGESTDATNLEAADLDTVLHEDLVPTSTDGSTRAGQMPSAKPAAAANHGRRPLHDSQQACNEGLHAGGLGGNGVHRRVNGNSVDEVSRSHDDNAAAVPISASPAGRHDSSMWWTKLSHLYLPFKLSSGASSNGQVAVDHGAFIVDISQDGPSQPCLLAFQDMRDVDNLLHLHRHRWQHSNVHVDMRHMRPREVVAFARSQGASVAVFKPGQLPLKSNMSEQEFVAMSAAYAQPCS
ncbi:hypothetical protein WJX74_008409 [Apatococcus lobatus]|uniref:LysM domain-containing protein n=1 Tax=Apatococcus lobatus TaxID=904363 RepID=A0AAW1RSY0_9CHLO